MNFRVNDIVRNAPGWKPGVYVITELRPERPKNQYDGVSLTNGKIYRLGDDSLSPKRVGVADAGWNAVATVIPLDGNKSADVDHNWFSGQSRAQREISSIQVSAVGGSCTQEQLDDIKRWEKLASLKPGDKFPCNVRGKIQNMTFRYICERGYKYVFVAENENGTRYKYPLRVVLVR